MSQVYDQYYRIVRLIPVGKVATYGQIASLAGRPRHARHVGYALYHLPADCDDVPWQRVINGKGEVSYSFIRMGSDRLQFHLLQDEGIEFDARERIDLKKYQWDPTPAELEQIYRLIAGD